MIVVDNVARASRAWRARTRRHDPFRAHHARATARTPRRTSPRRATIGPDATLLAGTDASGRPLMYAPEPLRGRLVRLALGHERLSEPPHGAEHQLRPPVTTDATLSLLRDIGWFLGSTTLPTTWVLPSSAHAQGANNAFYTTALTVTNTGSVAANLTLKFLGHDQDGRGGAEVPRVVPAGPDRDVRRRPRARSSASRADSAPIRIVADTNNLKIVSQTSTPPPSGVGTFGQAVPAADGQRLRHDGRPEGPLLAPAGRRVPDERGRSRTRRRPRRTWISQLFNVVGRPVGSAAHGRPQPARDAADRPRRDGPRRSRRNEGRVPRRLDADGRRADRDVRRRDRPEHERPAHDPPRDDRGARDERDAGSCRPARTRRERTTPSTRRTSRSRTPADSTATVTLKFLGHDQDGRGGAGGDPDASPATPPSTYTDVLGSLFGVSSGFGAILVTSDSANLKVLSQTSTPPPNLVGTFGQSVPAAGAADFVTLAAPKTLVGLRQDSAFRTNAVIANATGQPAHVDLTLQSETARGARERAPTTSSPYEMRQIGTRRHGARCSGRHVERDAQGLDDRRTARASRPTRPSSTRRRTTRGPSCRSSCRFLSAPSRSPRTRGARARRRCR